MCPVQSGPIGNTAKSCEWTDLQHAGKSRPKGSVRRNRGRFIPLSDVFRLQLQLAADQRCPAPKARAGFSSELYLLQEPGLHQWDRFAFGVPALFPDERSNQSSTSARL